MGLRLPNEDAIARLVGAILLTEWRMGRPGIPPHDAGADAAKPRHRRIGDDPNVSGLPNTATRVRRNIGALRWPTVGYATSRGAIRFGVPGLGAAVAFEEIELIGKRIGA